MRFLSILTQLSGSLDTTKSQSVNKKNEHVNTFFEFVASFKYCLYCYVI